MGKVVRSLGLAAVMVGLVAAGGLGTATAVQKDKGKAAEKAEKAGTVEVYTDKAGEFRFRIKDAEGKVVAMCTKGYNKKEDAMKALDFVKATLNSAKATEVKK